MKPRKDRARWREGAPEYVAAVRDAGARRIDCFTVYLTGSLALTAKSPADQPRLDAVEEYLGCGKGGRGFSQFGEAPRGNRRYAGKTIRWLDLDEATREHVISRCTA